MNNFSFGPQPSNGVPAGNTGWAINGMGEATQIGLETASTQGLALGWDGLGRLAAATATPNGVIQTYRYAPSGMRVNVIDAAQPANNRRFAYSTGGSLLAEYNDAGWKRDVVYLGSEAIAEIDASGVYELHNDHLGTPRVITRGSSIVGTQTFGPYGEYIANYSSGYQPLTGYTGHVQTDATRLIYMRGRYYSPSWHRFLNSDHGADDSTFNQRSYVDGKVFAWTDPSGMEAIVEVVDTMPNPIQQLIMLWGWDYLFGGGGGGGGMNGGPAGHAEPAVPPTPQPQTPQDRDKKYSDCMQRAIDTYARELKSIPLVQTSNGDASAFVKEAWNAWNRSSPTHVGPYKTVGTFTLGYLLGTWANYFSEQAGILGGRAGTAFGLAAIGGRVIAAGGELYRGDPMAFSLSDRRSLQIDAESRFKVLRIDCEKLYGSK